jgi:hypothetical protein
MIPKHTCNDFPADAAKTAIKKLHHTPTGSVCFPCLMTRRLCMPTCAATRRVWLWPSLWPKRSLARSAKHAAAGVEASSIYSAQLKTSRTDQQPRFAETLACAKSRRKNTSHRPTLPSIRRSFFLTEESTRADALLVRSRFAPIVAVLGAPFSLEARALVGRRSITAFAGIVFSTRQCGAPA